MHKLIYLFSDVEQTPENNFITHNIDVLNIENGKQNNKLHSKIVEISEAVSPCMCYSWKYYI